MASRRRAGAGVLTIFARMLRYVYRKYFRYTKKNGEDNDAASGRARGSPDT
ncbi:hypothetical protein AZA_89404 [Nitrospirillum viridazoti Y2]|nr:hypothetical protein AZA_89404 [Nitrospirillum amazonense Y2]